MLWICEKLELPDPEIVETPSVEIIETDAERYLDHLLMQWRKPLTEVPRERFFKPEYTTRWGVQYCIEAMLEHAVLHPIRHHFQLEELMGQK
jgi:hypothetical protein